MTNCYLDAMELFSLALAAIRLGSGAERKLRPICAMGSVPDSITKGLLYILIAVVLLFLLIGLNRWKAIKPRRRKK